MLKVNNQLSFCLSSHASLFNVLIKKDNFWRQLKHMVDFSFVYDELKDKYSSTMGRKAEEETSTNLIHKLIAKTVELSLQEGVIEVHKKIIQDSTHTNAMYQHISPREELIKQAKELRKSIYKLDETMHSKMPKKRESTGVLEDQIKYTKELLNLVKEEARFTTIPAINEKKIC